MRRFGSNVRLALLNSDAPKTVGGVADIVVGLVVVVVGGVGVGGCSRVTTTGADVLPGRVGVPTVSAMRCRIRLMSVSVKPRLRAICSICDSVMPLVCACCTNCRICSGVRFSTVCAGANPARQTSSRTNPLISKK